MVASFEEFVGTYAQAVQVIARAARACVLELIPDAQEEVDPQGHVIGYGYGGYKGLVFTIILSKSAVKLGVVGGASLPDPECLLRGAGNVHKYIPLHTAADLQLRALRTLLTRAATQRRQRLGRR
jgi:hypothetical protein